MHCSIHINILHILYLSVCHFSVTAAAMIKVTDKNCVYAGAFADFLRILWQTNCMAATDHVTGNHNWGMVDSFTTFDGLDCHISHVLCSVTAVMPILLIRSDMVLRNWSGRTLNDIVWNTYFTECQKAILSRRYAVCWELHNISSIYCFNSRCPRIAFP